MPGRLASSPLRYSAALALVYMIGAGGYVLGSSYWAGGVARSVEDLARTEMVKGTFFVGGTTVALGLFSFFLFRRIAVFAEESLRAREVLLSAERRGLAGVLASCVAHDCNNLLSVTRSAVGELRQALRDDPDPERKELTQEIDDCVEQLVVLLRRLSDAGRDNAAGERSRIDLADFATRTLRLLGPHEKVKACRVHTRADAPVLVDGYPTLLRQALMNLVINAAEATGPGGMIEVHVRAREPDAVIEVHEDGPGIPPPDRGRVLEPFFTTKEDGTGLGFISARVCADSHSGRLELDDSPLGGACVRLALPRAVPAERSHPRGATAPRAAGRTAFWQRP